MAHDNNIDHQELELQLNERAASRRFYMEEKYKGINFKFPLKSFRKGFYESNTTTIDAVTDV